MEKKSLMQYMLLCLSLFPMISEAQMFSDRRWHENTVIMGKWSPLYYELNVGANVSERNYSADFIYFSVGYGKPSTTNDWSNYLSKQSLSGDNGTSPSQPTQPSPPSQPTGNGGGSQPTQPEMPSQPEAPSVEGSMSGIHAGMVAIGWQHFFNHWMGFHLQAGWGFVVDLGDGDDDNKSSSQYSSDSQDYGEKKTFIYNGVPTQAGLDFNLWEHVVLQVGATYMWKEKPYVTLGLGITF